MDNTGRIITFGNPAKKKDREMYKTEVKPCKTIKASQEEIAEELKKLGIREDENMVQMYKDDLERYLDEGMDKDEIANATGLKVGTVIKKANTYGLGTALKLNEKPKQKDVIPAVVENGVEGSEKYEPKQVPANDDKKPAEPKQGSDSHIDDKKKPCKITLADIDDKIVETARELEDLKTAKMILMQMAGSGQAIEICLGGE